MVFEIGQVTPWKNYEALFCSFAKRCQGSWCAYSDNFKSGIRQMLRCTRYLARVEYDNGGGMVAVVYTTQQNFWFAVTIEILDPNMTEVAGVPVFAEQL